MQSLPKDLFCVREILRTTNRALARKQLIELLRTDDYHPGSPRTLFVQFLVDRAKRRRGVKPLRVSTMMLLTTLLARRWIAFAPSALVPTHLEPIGHDTLRKWYLDMIESCTGNTAIRLVTALRAFTEWLVEADAVEPEPPRDILPGSPPVAVVSAEWLVQGEIDAVRQAVRISPEYFIGRWDREVAICSVDLARAAGLRRSEETGTRLCDFQVHRGEITLALRAHPARRLKSLSAVRTVRLIALGDVVREHLIKLVDGASQSSTQLWSRAMCQSDNQRMDYSMAPAINNCMQRTLDAPKLHHHHLRHTCANHALIALMSRYISLHDHFDQFPWLADIVAQREMYEDMLDRRPTFRGDDLWAIAGWLGHSSPEVTLRHYLHCMDLLQYVGLSRYDEQESRAILIALGVLSERERRRKQPGGKLALLRTITDQFPEAFCCSEPLDRPQYNAVTQGAQLFRKLEDAWIAGHESLSGRFDTRLSVPKQIEDAIDLYIQEAQKLACVPSGRRGTGFRHPMERVSDSTEPWSSAQYAWPAGLKYRSAGSIAFQFCCAISSGGETVLELTRAVLRHWRDNALAKDELAACETKEDVELYRRWLSALRLDYNIKVAKRTRHRRKYYVGIRAGGRRYERAGLIWLLQMLLITNALNHVTVEPAHG